MFMIDEEHSILIENTERCKNLKIDSSSCRVYFYDKEISISPIVYKILEFLMPNKLLFTYEQKHNEDIIINWARDY
tara:strand:+ start:198 stop:425 length:228 start_codon:yes stop_codon:yes gene_type:complete